MFKNRVIALTLIVVVVSQLLCGCSSKSDFLTVKGVLNSTKIKSIESNLSMYENKDGGFRHYFNSEDSLYYTYHCLNILNRYGELNLKIQQDVCNWMSNVEMYYFSNNDAFLVLNNIFYYLSIAKLTNYNIPEDRYNTIIETVESLYDEQGFYLKASMNTSDSNELSPTKILANTRGIEIFTLLNKEIPNREYIENWCYRLIDKPCDSKIERIGNIGSSISILNMLGLSPIQQNQQIKEFFEEYIMPDKIVFLDLYYLFIVNDYLEDQKIIDAEKIDYINKINSYASEDGFVFDNNNDGNILFIDLAMKMDFKLNKSITWDSTIEVIKKMQLSNGSFSDSSKIDSDMIDTFYAYKCFKILGVESDYTKSLIKYFSNVEIYYDDLDDYEKIVDLDMKFDLGISNKSDLEKVNDLIEMAYSHDVEKNYLFVNHLLTVCKKYNVKINSDYIVKIEAFIKDKISKEYDSIEASIFIKLFAYELATKIESYNSNILKSEIMSEFQMNYNNYEDIDALVVMMLESNLMLKDDVLRDSLKDNNVRKIDYNILHNNLNLNEEGDKGFYPMYLTLFILAKL